MGSRADGTDAVRTGPLSCDFNVLSWRHREWAAQARAAACSARSASVSRGSFTSVKELIAVIGDFIDYWNELPHPFAWTKDADEILAKIERAKTKQPTLQATRLSSLPIR